MTPNVVGIDNEMVLQLHEVLILEGYLGTKSLTGEDPSALNVALIDVILDCCVVLPFCGKEMTSGIQRVTKMREMLYRYANRLRKEVSSDKIR